MATPITPIPQRHQLTLKMEAPLWDDQQVEFISDLQNVKYLYKGKLVWVKEDNCWFYYVGRNAHLEPGGIKYTLIWKRQNSRTQIRVYNSSENYIEGETIFCNGKIYNAVKDVTQSPSPPNNPKIPYEDSDNLYWMAISGEIEYYKFEFEKLSSFVLQSEISEPIFTCWVDNEGTMELVQPSIEKLAGNEYEISFWEYDFDEYKLAPKEKSGYIFIK